MSDRLRPAMTMLLLAALAVPLAARDVPDPTQPPGPEERARWSGRSAATPETWRVEMVLIGPERRVAIVNGRRVAAGDRIGTARVVGIDPGLVRLDVDGTLVDVPVRHWNRNGRHEP